MNRSLLVWLLLLAVMAILWLPWIGSVVITPDLPTFLNVASLILTGLLVIVTIQWPYRLPFVLRRVAVLGTLWALSGAAYVISKGWPYQGAEIISLVNIGAACDRLKQPQQAHAVLEPAVKASRKYGYLIALAYALNNLGSAQAENEPLQALDYYRQALRHCTGLARNPTAKIAITANIADIHRRLGEYGQAFDLLEDLQALVRQVKSRSLEGMVLRNLGQVYRDAGEPGHALAIFSRAMDYARATRHFSYAAAVLADVSAINVTLGRKPEAITALSQAIAILEAHSLPHDIEGRTAEHLHAQLAELRAGAMPGSA